MAVDGFGFGPLAVATQGWLVDSARACAVADLSLVELVQLELVRVELAAPSLAMVEQAHIQLDQVERVFVELGQVERAAAKMEPG